MERKVRLIALASLVVLAAAFGLLAIPQFIVPNDYPILDSISGYQFFFHAVSDRYEALSGMKGVSGLGITSIVLMALALASFLFSKKSSALSLLGGLLNVAASVLFFAMEASKKSVYGSRYTFVNVGWPAYVIGGLLVLTGLLAIYFSIRLILEEKKVIASSKSYSYLKK